MKVMLCIIAGPLFLIALTAHIYVKIKLRKEYDSDLDDYYYEFEEQHLGLARYNKWSKITFAAIALSVLLLFLAAVI